MASSPTTQKHPSPGASLSVLLFYTSGRETGVLKGRGAEGVISWASEASPPGFLWVPMGRKKEAAKGTQQASRCSTPIGFPHCHTHNAIFRPQPRPSPCHSVLAAWHSTPELGFMHLYHCNCVAALTYPVAKTKQPCQSQILQGPGKCSAARNSSALAVAPQSQRKATVRPQASMLLWIY